MKTLAVLVMVLSVALLVDVGEGWFWRRRRHRTGKRLGALEKVQEDVKKVEEEAVWELAMEELDNLAEVLKGDAEGQLQDDAGSFQKKEESGLQLDAEAAGMEENEGGLQMEEETDGGLEEEEETGGGLEEENDGGLVMEELKELEEELEVLKEDLEKGQ